MSTKYLQFRIDLQSVQANDSAVGYGTLHVEIYGPDPFLGLSVWHEAWERRHYNQSGVIMTRTGVFNPNGEFQTVDSKHYKVTSISDIDPLIATARVVRAHLEEAILPELGAGVAAKLAENPLHQAAYHDQVVEPICTAVLGMCRNPILYEGLDNAERLWTIGTWRLRIVAENGRAQLLDLGTEVQDVLVVQDNEENRRLINRALLH